MTAHELLLKKIREAIELSDGLSKTENDIYAATTTALLIAERNIDINMDRSAECKCKCHTGQSRHCAPCPCYRGFPQ